MSHPSKTNSDVPLLSEKHSGIPDFLLEKAKDAKAWVFKLRTKPDSERKRPPVIPQGVEENVFLSALDELRSQIGATNVERNDKPLIDGW